MKLLPCVRPLARSAAALRVSPSPVLLLPCVRPLARTAALAPLAFCGDRCRPSCSQAYRSTGNV